MINYKIETFVEDGEEFVSIAILAGGKIEKELLLPSTGSIQTLEHWARSYIYHMGILREEFNPSKGFNEKHKE